MEKPHFLTSEMKKRGIRSPFDLREDDQWVNDATRQDIEALVRQGPVFGLEFWTWNKFRGDELKDVKNFQLDLLFKEEDESKVDKAIADYKIKKGEGFRTTREIIDELQGLAIYTCLWV